ncbi:exo-alpha-sialidase [Mucilaginibacter rigui]|uniref:Exo-alpha-sialidase n=1 Tax=Mucilaginibacter rigui TaxID=534635 RepID=A0ABR7X272_9SPHI|nr:sialidase family protein [Mucilaginibacter rigui]MBD1384694.1 exo-alpha-sialidase [Mucilaginibacter rigui]
MKIKYTLVYLSLVFLRLNVFAQTTNGLSMVTSEFIFENAPFKSCHASTIVKLDNNNLMAAWFGGTSEGSPDVCIWAAIYLNGAWAKPVIVADGIQHNGKQYPCWNPVLFKARDGKLYLHYKVGLNPREWWAMYKYSTDDGKTWSAAIRLPAGYLGPVKNKPLQLANGDVLYPSSTESLDEKHWQVHLEKSDSGLNNWQKITIDCDTFQTIQPSLLTYPHNKLQLLARSKQNVIVQSWSEDGGGTWSKMTKTALPNPNSGSDAVTVNGMQLLVYNPLPAGLNWWEGRSVLKLASSADGVNWHDVFTFENEKKGEYSYPAIIADTLGDIFITYTYNRSRIKFVQFKLN